MSNFKTFCLLIFLLILSSSIKSQDTIRVPLNNQTIQSALNSASSETVILVSDGVYYENLVWPDNIDGIQLISVNGSASTIIDGDAKGRVIEIEGDYTFSNEPQTISSKTALIGFTIQNGYLLNGGGIGLLVNRASPTLKNLVIQNNLGVGEYCSGAGALLSTFSGTIENCHITNNNINSESRSYGAGLYIEAIDNVKLLDCIIENNHGNTLQWCYGGGVFFEPDWPEVEDSITFILENCSILNNSVTTDSWAYGAGIYIDDFREQVNARFNNCIISNNSCSQNSNWCNGAGVYSSSKNMEFIDCKLENNSARRGTAIYLDPERSEIANNYSLSNCSIINNNYQGTNTTNGTAIYVGRNIANINMENCVVANNDGSPLQIDVLSNNDDKSEAKLNHCTFAYNANWLWLESVDFVATNSIFWANGDEQQFVNSGESDISISYSLVDGGYEGDAIINSDPLFLNEQLLIPLQNSPCHFAGIILEELDNDILGNQRPLPANSPPDIGAYEVDQYFAHVHVSFYFDENENGIKDNSERNLSFGSINLNNESIVYNFHESGTYLLVDQGPNRIEYAEHANLDWTISSESSHDFNVNTDDFSARIEFGLTPNEPYSELVTFISAQNFRCGEEVDMSVTVMNYGTTIESGILWLSIDSRLENYEFSIEPDFIEDEKLVGWSFNDLYPQEAFGILFTVTAPLIENETQLGEIYEFKSRLADDPVRDNIFCYDAELRCSFDPNDKLVSPNRPDSLSLLDKTLFYTVRFQNTGNDYARHVSIVDTLDKNLDLKTFNYINSSHADKLQISFGYDNEVRFDFQNIFLPDSTENLVGSNGHISYSIKPKLETPLESVVSNTAHIYFDFNPAIVTNTTQNILVDEFPTIQVEDIDDNIIEIYPNPAEDIIYLSQEVQQLKLYDMHGKLVLIGNNTDFLNIEQFNSGTYMLILKNNNSRIVEKVVFSK